ncbi:MAG: hypothetical protein AAF560_24395 [Acidobacteriota bacterium]
MNQRIPFIVLFLAIVCSMELYAQTEVQVRLRVTADTELNQAIVQCLEERLTAASGVRVEADAEVQLRLIALEQKSTDDTTFGYLFYQAGLIPSQDPTAPHVLWETLRSLPPDLPAACDRLASDFQTRVIAPVRQSLERFRDQLQEKAPSQ